MKLAVDAGISSLHKGAHGFMLALRCVVCRMIATAAATTTTAKSVKIPKQLPIPLAHATNSLAP